MFVAGLIDEWFLTLAPKVKGGRHIPTTVEGDGLPREQVVRLELVSVYENEGELYLRYRRVR
jgi:riboflavin biosynthesis pyrimidine reductase